MAQHHAELGMKLSEVGLQPSFYKQVGAKESSITSKDVLGKQDALALLFQGRESPGKNRSRKKEKPLQPSQQKQ